MKIPLGGCKLDHCELLLTLACESFWSVHFQPDLIAKHDLMRSATCGALFQQFPTELARFADFTRSFRFSNGRETLGASGSGAGSVAHDRWIPAISGRARSFLEISSLK